MAVSGKDRGGHPSGHLKAKGKKGKGHKQSMQEHHMQTMLLQHS